MSTEQEIVARLRALEDRAAITGLIASYGPLVDSGDAEGVSGLWTENGSYSVDGATMNGRREIAAMVRGSQHQGLIRTGCTHLLSNPTVVVNGDSASATCQSVLMAGARDGYRIIRLSINRFELVRAGDGWLIERRITHKLPRTADDNALQTPDAEQNGADN